MAHATVRPSTSAHTAHRGSKIWRSSVASRRNSAGGRRDEAPVARPGATVDFTQALDLALELTELERTDDDAMFLLEARRELHDRRLDVAAEVVEPRVQVLHFPVTRRLEVVRILRRVVRHHQHRVGVEAVDEESGALVERWVERPAQQRAAAVPRPRLHVLQQGPRALRSPSPRRTRRRRRCRRARRCAGGRQSPARGRPPGGPRPRGAARHPRARRTDSSSAKAARAPRCGAAESNADRDGCDRRRSR